MRWRLYALTGFWLLATAPSCSGVGAVDHGPADGGAPDAIASSSGSGSSGGSSGGSSSSGGGAGPDASPRDDAGWTHDSGESQDSGAPADSAPPPQDGGGAVCPNDTSHAEEAVAAIAHGNPVTCATLTCSAGQCCFVQPSPFNVCVAQ